MKARYPTRDELQELGITRKEFVKMVWDIYDQHLKNLGAGIDPDIMDRLIYLFKYQNGTYRYKINEKGEETKDKMTWAEFMKLYYNQVKKIMMGKKDFIMNDKRKGYPTLKDTKDIKMKLSDFKKMIYDHYKQLKEEHIKTIDLNKADNALLQEYNKYNDVIESVDRDLKYERRKEERKKLVSEKRDNVKKLNKFLKEHPTFDIHKIRDQNTKLYFLKNKPATEYDIVGPVTVNKRQIKKTKFNEHYKKEIKDIKQLNEKRKNIYDNLVKIKKQYEPSRGNKRKELKKEIIKNINEYNIIGAQIINKITTIPNYKMHYNEWEYSDYTNTTNPDYWGLKFKDYEYLPNNTYSAI